MTKITDKMIREYLSHGEGNRKVRIKRDGTVEYYGSRSDTDRQHDYWHFGGYRAEVALQLQAHRICAAATKKGEWWTIEIPGQKAFRKNVNTRGFEIGKAI